MVKKREVTRWIKKEYRKGKPICLVPPCNEICEKYISNDRYRNYCKDHDFMDMGQYTNWQILRQEAIDRDNSICKLCGNKAINPIVDHIEPIALGGEEFDLENLQTLCQTCNKEKTSIDQFNIAILRRKEKKQLIITNEERIRMEKTNLKIEYIEIEKLTKYNENPRNNEEAIEPVAKSIKKFGFNNPILVDKDLRICAGHTRLEAAKLLKLLKIPIIRLDLTKEQFKAFNIADNKTAELAEWDELGLSKIIKELKEEDEELLQYLGFEDTELEQLLSKVEEEEPIDQEEKEERIPANIPERVKLGEIWKLGNHRLICGDALKLETYELLFNNKEIDLVMTSPPYWGLRDYGIKDQMGLEEHPNLFIMNMVKLSELIKNYLKKTGSIYYNLGDTYFGSMQGYGQKPGQGSGIQNASDGHHASSNQKPPAANKEISSNWLQPKQLMMMPSRVAIALQEAGFILRNDII